MRKKRFSCTHNEIIEYFCLLLCLSHKNQLTSAEEVTGTHLKIYSIYLKTVYRFQLLLEKLFMKLCQGCSKGTISHIAISKLHVSYIRGMKQIGLPIMNSCFVGSYSLQSAINSYAERIRKHIHFYVKSMSKIPRFMCMTPMIYRTHHQYL